MTGLLLAALWTFPGPGDAPCAPGGCFNLQLDRPQSGIVNGIDVRVEAPGSQGVQAARGVSSDSGALKACLPELKPGDMVEVRVVAPLAYRLLYPPRGRLAVSCTGSVSIVVCESGRDCTLSTLEEAMKLVQASRVQVEAFPTQESKEAFFRDWLAYARQLEPKNDLLFAELVRKERQITAASHAERLLSQFENRARELLVRFERHATVALAQSSVQSFLQMNEAARDYNPIFNDLKDNGDSYVQEVSDHWNAAIGAGLGRLVDDAREFHVREIYSLNDANTGINACIHRWPACADKPAVTDTVARAVEGTRARALPRLDAYALRLAAWKESVRTGLYDGPDSPRADLTKGE